MASFSEWFAQLTRHNGPHEWQRRLAEAATFSDRLIRIPTGLGKTEGVLASWIWNVLEHPRTGWPRRLVWCLPMRVLVEQTIRIADQMTSAWRQMHSAAQGDEPPIRVQALMGGADLGDWYLHPEQAAILVGTQDMLLSRGLNRGYAAGRARWPIEYGLLNQDCLWIMDEVQLMDVGLATSVQLQAFRNQDRDKWLRPCGTWWMSATLQPEWLRTVDFEAELEDLQERVEHVPPKERKGGVWNVKKPLAIEAIDVQAKWEKWSDLVLRMHREAQPANTGRLTLVVVNRVDTACEIHRSLQRALAKCRDSETPQLELIHSRFRGIERREWTKRFLSREHSINPSTNLILVSTQVVEAGVDISASALVTELAPWPNLVQRFGRAARYGGAADLVVVDRQHKEKDAAPYEKTDLDAARDALGRLEDGGIASLEEFEAELTENDPELLARLYRYEYIHLLTRREADELFDTSTDLTGADLDISRFIRSGEERDLHVCWVPPDWDKDDPPSELQPLRDGLCPVKIADVRKWLFDKNNLKHECRAWGWDYLDGRWRRLTSQMCYPGQLILISAAWGGYDATRGFTGEKAKSSDPAISLDGTVKRKGDKSQADFGQGRDDASLTQQWKTIATHGDEVAGETRELSKVLDLPERIRRVFELVGRLHDWGKAHPAFQCNVRLAEAGPRREDFAKAPEEQWVSFRSPEFAWPEKNRPEMTEKYGHRIGFRHELASALAILELMAQNNPYHDGLLGGFHDLVEQGILKPPSEVPPSADNPLVEELKALDATDFNLLLYLVCCHHGKVRGAWQASPQDQEFPSENPGFIGHGQPLRGVRTGDRLPSVALALRGGSGQPVVLPAVTLHLDVASLGLCGRYGASWTERVRNLLRQYGPFTLGFLESLFRVADMRASALETRDPLLVSEVA